MHTTTMPDPIIQSNLILTIAARGQAGMNALRCLAIVAMLATSLCAQEATMPGDPTASPVWTASDYALHTPQSIRQHAPAKQVIRREKIDYGLLSAAIFYAANEQRIRHKVPPLAHSEALRRAAQTHTHDMAVGGFFSHDNPRDPTRRTPWQRMAAEGVDGGYCSENIAKTCVNKLTYLSAADAIVAMWMNLESAVEERMGGASWVM